MLKFCWVRSGGDGGARSRSGRLSRRLLRRRFGLRGRPPRDVVPGQIYRWRNELRSAVPGFAAVVVAPEASDRSTTSAPAVEIELGRAIRVRIAATAPEDLASAIIKALTAR